jgi:GMP reductase
MRIEDEIKLTFDDVLIRPKRSTLVSRSEVQLDRDLKFRHTSLTWSGVPIVSANMDTTGTFETAISLQKHKMITAILTLLQSQWANLMKTCNLQKIFLN